MSDARSLNGPVDIKPIERLNRGWILICLILAFLNGSCARIAIKGPEEAFRKVSAPDLDDDLPLEPLAAALEIQIQTLENSTSISKFVFGPDVYTKEQYVKGLKRFVELLPLASADRKKFFDTVAAEFDFYEVYGQAHWNDVLVTSYFEPIIPGSLRKSSRFSQPLYAEPEDLIRLDLNLFDEKYATDRKLRGRLEGRDLLPYYSRSDIDGRRALSGKKLELCWVDPVDAFFLQIQGSGTVDLLNGKSLRLIYAEKNGQRYESIGKFLKDKLPPEQLTLQGIEAYLRALPETEMRELLDRNPSYVFFKVAPDGAAGAVTALGVPATAGRTVATDPRFFSKGALAFLVSEKPVFETPQSTVPASWAAFSRFVLDQDVGGAIVGPGRLDLFWGRGQEAKQNAGVMKQKGKLFYIAPKPTTI